MSENMNIRYEIYYGPISKLHRTQLSPLRLTLFSGYPYLYCGSPEREAKLWEKLSHESTLLTLAYDHDHLVGAITAQALDNTDHSTLQQHIQSKAQHCLMVDIAMVIESHQRRGIAREMMNQFQNAAHEQGYSDMYGITVVRSNNHPLKPAHFTDIDEVWSKTGWKRFGLTEVWNWPTRCGVPGNEFIAPIDNMVQYWHKQL